MLLLLLNSKKIKICGNEEDDEFLRSQQYCQQHYCKWPYNVYESYVCKALGLSKNLQFLSEF
jgi:hypothetical protein